MEQRKFSGSFLGSYRPEVVINVIDVAVVKVVRAVFHVLVLY